MMRDTYKKHETAKCLHCDQDKDTAHVWICQATKVQELWDTSLQHLHTLLRDTNTSLQLQELIITGLNNWRHGIQISPEPEAPDFMHRQPRLG